MACHYLYLKNQREFFDIMKQRDPEIIMKMVKCVLSAHKRNKEKRVKHKKMAVEMFKNTCNDCGCTSEHQEIFDFHHISPDEKEFSIAHIIHYGWAKIEAELKKCVMLCANCHRIRHAKENK